MSARALLVGLVVAAAAGAAAWWATREDVPAGVAVEGDDASALEGGGAPASGRGPLRVDRAPPPAEALFDASEVVPPRTAAGRPLVRVLEVDAEGRASSEAVRRALTSLEGFVLRYEDAATRAQFEQATFAVPRPSYEPRESPEGVDLSMFVPSLHAAGFHLRVEPPLLVVASVGERRRGQMPERPVPPGGDPPPGPSPR
jgi:hypothetical protein